jgi:D-xylose transport system permease protein
VSTETENLVTEPTPAPTGNVLKLMINRFRRGDSGMIPIVGGLLIMGVYFEVRSSAFLSVGNLTNLAIQGCIFVLLGMAEIWLLLLGEIDLSAGFTAGLSGAVAVILVDLQFGWPWYLALSTALIVSVVVGALWGALVIGLRIPSFIVTLAGQFGLQGGLIWMVDAQGTGGTISVHETVLYNIVYGNLTPLFTWIFIVGTVAILSFSMVRKNASRAASNLESVPMSITLMKIGGLVVSGAILGWVFNSNRGTFTVLKGMPYAILLVGAILAAWTFILNKTKAGRYLYAIGGNAEAARRAGIAVNRYRMMAFMMCGLTSGIAGLVYVSNLNGISDGIPGGNLVLYAVASAVIGGTSLFGGRGKMMHAIIGGFVIATIYNGLALLQFGAAQQYIATALVLLAAVTIDSLARRGSTLVR